MKRNKMVLSAVLATTALVLAGGAYMFMGAETAWSPSGQKVNPEAVAAQYASCKGGAIAGGLHTLGGDFDLLSSSGERTTSAGAFSKPSLLYFGYTFCPDVCPLDLLRNSEVTAIMAEKGLEIEQVFITLDPMRDTPEVMKNYAEAIDPSIVGLTGTPSEIDEVAKSWRVSYEIPQSEGDEDYTVNHMTYTYLVMPDQGTVGLFSRNLTAETIAERVGCFMDNR